MSDKLHSLLARQIKQIGLDQDEINSHEKLGKFIDKVNKTYLENDQERYLSERSIGIFSKEISSLNQKLQTAQNIAKLGYWEIDKKHEKLFWSKEMYLLHGINDDQSSLNYENFLNMIHEDNRPSIKKIFEKAFQETMEYNEEIRMKNPDGEYHWFQIIFFSEVSENASIIKGISMNISDRKEAEEKVLLLHEQLLSAARHVGMADIAASTLHNVGNVLNSAIISIELIKEKVSDINNQKIFDVFNLLKCNKTDLISYFSKDPKGTLIPNYLLEIASPLEEDFNAISSETNEIRTYLQHIRDIVSTQKNIGHSSGLVEKVNLSKVIDSALQMANNSLQFKSITIQKEYDSDINFFVDRVKLLQILVNLIQNAKEAIIENQNASKKEIIISAKKDLNTLVISCKDSGTGILPENIEKIFSFGFSTKETGHGFGLHSSALAAVEMKGELQVESEGLGKGTSFILTLPLDLEAYESTQ